VAIPHTLGNWRTCCHHTPATALTTRRIPAIRQLPATAACDQRTHHYISLLAGTNSPFQGPTNFTQWILYPNNGNPTLVTPMQHGWRRQLANSSIQRLHGIPAFTHNRFHRTLKAAIVCHADQQWAEALPPVLLRIYTAFTEDLQASVAELVYSEPLSIPSKLLTPATDPADPVHLTTAPPAHGSPSTVPATLHASPATFVLSDHIYFPAWHQFSRGGSDVGTSHILSHCFADQQSTLTPQVNSTWLHIAGSSHIHTTLVAQLTFHHHVL
jgi:hypothetical protein